MPDRSDTWDGGYKRQNVKGKKVFVIYRRVNGRLYEISTRCTSSSAANDHWRRFQADPENYRPEGEKPKDAIALDDELGEAFLKYSLAKGNTRRWVRDQKKALAWWEEQLGNIDLRRLTTEAIVDALDDAPARKQKIATLKHLYAWLRTERHRIEAGEDPLLGRVKVPQSKPQQMHKVKAIEPAEYLRVHKALSGWPRDALEVLAATGWHFTELERFAVGGELTTHPLTGAPVLLCPRTKGGRPHRTQVSPEVLAAAGRLRALERGTVDYFRLRDALIVVGAKFNPGYFRHSVATHAVNSGADPGVVSAFLDHLSASTTKRFYATHAVPARVPTLSDLNVSDAPLPSGKTG